MTDIELSLCDIEDYMRSIKKFLLFDIQNQQSIPSFTAKQAKYLKKFIAVANDIVYFTELLKNILEAIRENSINQMKVIINEYLFFINKETNTKQTLDSILGENWKNDLLIFNDIQKIKDNIENQIKSFYKQRQFETIKFTIYSRLNVSMELFHNGYISNLFLVKYSSSDYNYININNYIPTLMDEFDDYEDKNTVQPEQKFDFWEFYNFMQSNEATRLTKKIKPINCIYFSIPGMDDSYEGESITNEDNYNENNTAKSSNTENNNTINNNTINNNTINNSTENSDTENNNSINNITENNITENNITENNITENNDADNNDIKNQNAEDNEEKERKLRAYKKAYIKKHREKYEELFQRKKEEAKQKFRKSCIASQLKKQELLKLHKELDLLTQQSKNSLDRLVHDIQELKLVDFSIISIDDHLAIQKVLQEKIEDLKNIDISKIKEELENSNDLLFQRRIQLQQSIYRYKTKKEKVEQMKKNISNNNGQLNEINSLCVESVFYIYAFTLKYKKVDLQLPPPKSFLYPENYKEEFESLVNKNDLRWLVKELRSLF